SRARAAAARGGRGWSAAQGAGHGLGGGRSAREARGGGGGRDGTRGAVARGARDRGGRRARQAVRDARASPGDGCGAPRAERRRLQRPGAARAVGGLRWVGGGRRLV